MVQLQSYHTLAQASLSMDDHTPHPWGPVRRVIALIIDKGHALESMAQTCLVCKP